MAVDGEGRLWVFWSANVDDNWDLYARSAPASAGPQPIRITTAPGSDFHHVAATDSEGRVWLAWQSFGEDNSDIFVARQEGDALRQADGRRRRPGNEWTPAIAASRTAGSPWPGTAMKEATTTCSRESGRPGQVGRTDARGRLAPTTKRGRAWRSTGKNRLWIAYEVSPEGWGKDFGPYDQSPKRTALYRQRGRRRQGARRASQLLAPESDVNRALPMPSGTPRLAEVGQTTSWPPGPKLAVDAAGRVWLSAGSASPASTARWAARG